MSRREKNKRKDWGCWETTKGNWPRIDYQKENLSRGQWVNRKFKIFFYICKQESANDKIDRWEKDCQGWLRKENS